MATTAVAASSPFLKGKGPATTSNGSGSGSNSANLSAAEKAIERTKLLFAQRALTYPDFASYKPAKELKAAHRGAVRSLGWSCDGNWLATCGDESIRIWAPERSVSCLQ
jgi:WD40 repeat protein